MNDGRKSDKSVVPKKLPNKGSGAPLTAEGIEERDLAKGNSLRQKQLPGSATGKAAKRVGANTTESEEG